MAKVICTLQNASEEISGVKFTETGEGMLSEDISDAQAAAFVEINGYEVFVDKKAQKAAKAAEAAAAQAAADKEAAAQAEARAKEEADASAADLAASNDAAEKTVADKAAAEAAAAKPKK